MRFKFIIVLNSITLVMLMNALWIKAFSQSSQNTQKVPEISTNHSERQLKASQELRNYINEVMGLPAEFKADILLKLIENKKISNKAWEKELLEDSFIIAKDAQNPYKRIGALNNEAESRSEYTSYAFDLKLDRVSLQLRVVKEMLQSNHKARAREMFSEIKISELTPITCDESTTYDLTEFYNTLNLLYQTAFSANERRKEEHLYFLISNIKNISSPAQISSIINSIITLKLSELQLQISLNTLSERLKELHDDDRSFSKSFGADINSIYAIVNVCKENHISPINLLNDYRLYLIKHLVAPRCYKNKVTIENEKKQVDVFNVLLLKHSLLKITDEQLILSKVQGKAKDYIYFRGQTKAQQIMREVSRLHWLPGTNTAIDDADKSKPQWEAQLTRVYNLIQEWQAKDEVSELDYFHQKAGIYRTLLQFVPDKSNREKIMKDYLIFLVNSPIQKEKRIDWFFQLNNMIKLLRHDSTPDRQQAESIFAEIYHPVLTLYAKLEKI
jgi:hypothetical protein